jgi:CelD/BcsL family acetyltransferase involved in cellulose biosynthesis
MSGWQLWTAGWEAFLPARLNPFASSAYISVLRDVLGQDARLFALSHGGERIGYPLILRPAGEYCDTVSPDYTGPLAASRPSEEAAAAFRHAFSDMCRETGIVAEFAHIHPWQCRTELLHAEGLETNREIVYVDLAWDEEKLWRESFAHSARKNVKRAELEGVRAFEAAGPGDIREFHRIYDMTMRRNNAAARYHFPAAFFLALFDRLRDQARFTMAEYKGSVVAGTLYLHDDQDVYSFLGGADHTWQHLRPTNLIIHDTILWGRRMAKSRLILGGGYRPDDGILRFKSTFSPLRRRFSVYKRIHNHEAYDALCAAFVRRWGAGSASQTFFPLYRSTPPQTETHLGDEIAPNTNLDVVA